MAKAILLAVCAVQLACCYAASASFHPVLRMRGGGEEVAGLGRAQQPLKRANAFKIAVSKSQREHCLGNQNPSLFSSSQRT